MRDDAFAVGRTRARPGPGPMPDAVIRALDLRAARRIDGRLAGDHRSTAQGDGLELVQVRPYQPGDDVRRMDWNVTARMRTPHVRIHVAERALATWLVLDVSPSMHFGTADRRKADVAEGVALAIARAAAQRRDRLGVVTFGSRAPSAASLPAGRAALVGLLAALREGPAPEGSGATSLGDALAHTARLARHRGAVVVVTDLRGPRDWRRPLVELAGRHHVLVVEIRDPREQELPDVGELWLIDPETGRELRVDTSSRGLRDRFAARAQEERREVAHDVRASGAEHLVLSTSGDWLGSLARALRKKGRAR